MTATVTIPLPTIFTPPASCLSVITYDGQSFWQNGISQTGDPSCYPASFYKIYNSYYSPGICPHSWTSAATAAHPDNPFDTAAFCCPSSYFVFSTTSQPVVDFACISLIGTDLENVFSTSTLSPGPLPFSPSLETVTRTDIPAGSNTVWADVIQVRWQSTDTDIISLLRESEKTAAAGPSTALAYSPAARSSTLASPTPPNSGAGSSTVPPSTPASQRIGTSASQSNSTTPSSTGLSPGSKAGIGVSVAFNVVLLVLIALIYLNQRRKRGSQRYETGHTTEEHRRKPRTTIPVEMGVNNSVELDPTPKRPPGMHAELFAES